MGLFDNAVEFVLENEKGLSQDPNDPGGITNYGISLRFLRNMPTNKLQRFGFFGDINEETIRILTIDQAKFIYHEEFWVGNYFDNINSEMVCSYLFDMVVNHGISQGVKLAQRATWAANFSRAHLKDDGIMGEETVAEINHMGDGLMMPLVATRAGFYYLCAAVNPHQIGALEGWLNRCYRVM